MVSRAMWWWCSGGLQGFVESRAKELAEISPRSARKKELDVLVEKAIVEKKKDASRRRENRSSRAALDMEKMLHGREEFSAAGESTGIFGEPLNKEPSSQVNREDQTYKASRQKTKSRREEPIQTFNV